VLRDGGLGDPELGPDDLGDRTRRLLTIGEQLQDVPAHGVAENIERMHRNPPPARATV
jgi:hypothetical protein